MRGCVVGCGYVGLVTGACLAHAGHEVICTDAQRERVGMLQSGRVPFFEPGLTELVQTELARGRLRFVDGIGEAVQGAAVAIVAVGTPADASGAPDLGALEAVARDLGWYASESTVVVIKSTVPVGTGGRVAQWIEAGIRARMTQSAAVRPQAADDCPVSNDGRVSVDVVSCPEFLREGCALADTFYAERIVMGVESERARVVMAELFAPFANGLVPYEGVSHRVPLVWLDRASAELAKYAANAFLATKISFINEFALLCESVGADVRSVARVMGMDRRIGPAFLDAGIGWGGSCFPKDLQAVLDMSRQVGLEADIVAAAVAVNDRQWHWVTRQLLGHLSCLEGQRIGLMGLAFKPDTDDLRAAPAIRIAEALHRMGAVVRAYDPVVREAQWDGMVPIEIADCPYALADGCAALVLVTEWAEFQTLDWGRMRLQMTEPFLLLDGRNALNARHIRDSGLWYQGLGWGGLS